MQKVLEQRGETGRVRVMLHSLAFGTLKLFVTEPMKDAVTQSQMDMTLDVMAPQPRVLDPGAGGPRPHDPRRAHLRE